jgi:tetratricopeptide (TPR) repeat protein
LLQRVLYAILLGLRLLPSWVSQLVREDDSLQEFLELSQKLQKQFPERPPYFLAIALTLKGQRCESREERMGCLPEAYQVWLVALDEGWDSRFENAAFLFFDTFFRLWQELVDLERNEDATSALIKFLSFACLDHWGTSYLLELGKRVLMSTNRYQDAVEIFLAWIARFMPDLQQLLQNQASSLQPDQPSSSNADRLECADACLFLVASSVLASDHQTAQKYIRLLPQCLDSLYDLQDNEYGQAIDMEANVKRLEAWQRLLPVPATVNQVTLKNFCETLPEQEQADLRRTGALAQLQMVGLASDAEFQRQLATFLQLGARVFGYLPTKCFETPVQADSCLAEHVLSLATPCTRFKCKSLALFMATFAPIVGFTSCLLTDARLWARFIQLLVNYSDRYAAQQSQSSTASNDFWLHWLRWLLVEGSDEQSDFLAFAKTTVSGATEGQTDEPTR